MMMPNEETSADLGQQDWTRGSALHHLWLQSTIRSMMTKITMTVIVVFLFCFPRDVYCITLASSHTKQTSVCTRRRLFAPEDWCFHQTQSIHVVSFTQHSSSLATRKPILNIFVNIGKSIYEPTFKIYRKLIEDVESNLFLPKIFISMVLSENRNDWLNLPDYLSLKKILDFLDIPERNIKVKLNTVT